MKMRVGIFPIAPIGRISTYCNLSRCNCASNAETRACRSAASSTSGFAMIGEWDGD